MKKVALVFMALVLCLGVFTGFSTEVNADEASAIGDPNKKAILVVSFGTSYADTRKITIEATENRFKEEFKDYDVVRAFTSQMIINILQKRDNIKVYNVKEALNHLKDEKYSQVIIQPLHIMNGAEYDELAAEASEFVDAFDDLKIGSPLLTSTQDYFDTIAALETQLPELEDNEAVVFMGHGTHHFANSTYSALEYALHDLGHKNVFVGTVEGYPGLDQVMNRLEENNIKKVTLMPFMLVAGDHASNDMAGDEDDSWKTVLKKAGYKVEIYLHGLGENKGIQKIYVEHARQLIEGNVEKDQENQEK
ncbi:sirohydrochlorin cobaltochelatase [Maledivibacter halophilus]|uniref:Anaerobic cobaltochelatase n=1 Tax=Maledivibacter halophilus TaxID=36842 RepID=A0A1T5M869_9FIRM|nr:sirohydrochlorin cobaltochelatase [Maledivibacter halophilus]SKC84335.1 anaerobic cobaltochelatase [Maledivibacter halophilus]